LVETLFFLIEHHAMEWRYSSTHSWPRH